MALTLTQFPNLYHTTIPEFGEAGKLDIRLQPSLSDETIVLAWALLLQGYTGEEVLTFHLDDAQVSVDIRSKSIHHFHGAGNGPRATAVLLRELVNSEDYGEPRVSSDGQSAFPHQETSIPARHAEANDSEPSTSQVLPIRLASCTLTLIYFRHTGLCHLKSFDAFPLSHLAEFGRQFESCFPSLHLGLGLSGFSGQASLKQSMLNQFPITLEGPQLLHELALKHNYDDEIAVDFTNENGVRTIISYALLREKALLFAAKIQRLSGARESPLLRRVIPVLLPQCPELYVVLLGILAAGAGFCPMNLDTPDDRIRFVFEDLNADLAVCMACDMTKFAHVVDVTFCAAEDLSTLQDGTAACEMFSNHSDDGYTNAKPQDAAYVMYTSGSTGQPKGVVVSHLAVTQSLLAHDQHIPHYSRFLQFAAPTFDVSMFEIFFTLFRGCTLVGCSRSQLLKDLPEIICQLDVDAAELTPTVAGTLLRKREDAPGLRLLLTIGEMLTKGVINEFGASESKESMLYGMYGPTEAAIHCTLQAEFSTKEKVGLIGRPLRTVSAFVAQPLCDESSLDTLAVVPVGHTGELVIGGAQLADGYLHRTEQTEKAFFKHPDYGMLYRTGDKARMLPNESIECLGRIQSGQIKLRGQRIELGEIEQAAMSLFACRLAVASVIWDNIVLFCLDNGNLTSKNVQEACQKWLLPHMMPNDIVLYPYFPQLPSGKIDKKSLEADYQATENAEDKTEHQSIDLETAQQICSMADEILRTNITKHTNLIKAGLDSIRAIQLASAIRRRKLYDISAVDILKSGSVNELCRKFQKSLSSACVSGVDGGYVAKVRDLGFAAPELAMLSTQVQDVLPCTPLQASMLAETLKNPKSYCNLVNISVDGKIISNVVFHALELLFRSNEILRSGFVPIEDSFVGFAQIIWKERADHQIYHVSRDSEDNLLSAETLDLLRPIRIGLYQRSCETVVAIEIHHALYDGWSLDLLLKDFDSAMDNLAVSSRPSFRGVVSHWTQTMLSSRSDSSRDYWERLLRDIQPAEFPDFPRKNQKSDHLRSATYEIPLKSKDFPYVNQFHPQVYVQTALAFLWSTYLASNDIVLGVVSSGRTIPVDDVESIIGPCIATVPLRLQSVCFHPIRTVMLSIQEQNRLALEHSSVPLREIKRLADLEPTQSIFDIVFAWQESLDSQDLSFNHIRHVEMFDFMDSKLFIEAVPNAEFIRLKATQRGGCLPDAQVEILLHQIGEVTTRLLESVKDDALQVPLSSISYALSDQLLSLNKESPEGFTKMEHNSYQCSNAILPIAGVVSHPLLSLDRYVLPLGGVGVLVSGVDVSNPQEHRDLRDRVFHHISQFDDFDETMLIGRSLHNDNFEILGRMKDFEIVNNQLLHISSISSLVRHLHFVSDCRTFVTSRDSKDIIITLWTPQLPSIESHDTDLQDFDVRFLPATDSYSKASKDISEELFSLLPLDLIPTYVIPIDAVSIHDIAKDSLVGSFHGLKKSRYLDSFECSRYNDVEPVIEDKLSIERKLVKCLAEVLEVHSPNITRTTSFFRLGLDSITAISFSRKLNRLHGLTADVSNILKYPTVSQLTSKLLTEDDRRILEPGRKGLNQLKLEIVSEISHRYEAQGFSVDKVVRCTPLQEAMLASSETNVYNNHTLFKIYLPGKQFRLALIEMLRRHEVLRTLFATTADLDFPFVQVVLKKIDLPWREVAYNDNEIDLILSEYTKFRLDPLDSMMHPFLATEITTSDQTYLLLSMHHVLYDGEAIMQLLSEIEDYLKGKSFRGTIPYEKFLSHALYTDFGKADDFWMKAFRGFRPIPLLQKQDTTTSKNQKHWQNPFIFSTESQHDLSCLEQATRNLAAPLNILCQAAWAKTLSVMLDTVDLCFGNVLNGRSIPLEGIENLVAPCFNTVPVRVRVIEECTNDEILRDLQNLNADIFAHQFTPLKRIQSQLGLTGMRLFDTLLLVQKAKQKLDPTIWTEVEDFGDMGIPLICEIIPDSETHRLRIKLHVDVSYILKGDCREIAEAFDSALASVITDAGANYRLFNHHGLSNWSKDRGTLILNRSKTNSIMGERRSDQNRIDPGNLVATVLESLSRLTKLPMDEISRRKSIFHLGLDSIGAIQLAKLIRLQGFEASSQDVMNGRTADGIAKIIQDTKLSRQTARPTARANFDFLSFNTEHKLATCQQCNICPEEIRTVRPCTQLQAGMLSQYLASDGQRYLNHFLLELDSGIDVEKLYNAWHSAFRKHEILRTGFAAVGNAKYPFVMLLYEMNALKLPWAAKSLGEQAPSNSVVHESVDSARKVLSKEILRSLHVPPWRLTLISFVANHQDQYLLDFSALHALYDAESLKMIFDEVRSFYFQNLPYYRTPVEPLLGHILVQADGEAAHRKYWQSILQEMPVHKFPDLNPLTVERSETKVVHIESYEFRLFEEGCRAQGVTIQAALQVAWARLLSEYLGEEDVLFGIVFSGRESEGADEIVFPSTTTVPFRTVVRKNINEMLQEAMNYNTTVRNFQHASLPQIARWAGLTDSGMFDTILVFQPQKWESSPCNMWTIQDEQGTVEVTRYSDEQLHFSLIFSSGVIPEAHGRLLLRQLVSMLYDTTVHKCSLYGTPYASMDLLSILPPHTVELPSEVQALHGLVESSVNLHPDRIALEFAPSLDRDKTLRWTYFALNSEGNKMANLILEQDIKPGCLVAVCFEKCAAASFALLGILKAGCAFLAIDPSAPYARKSFILEDSEATILLTTMDLARNLPLKGSIRVICVDALDHDNLNSNAPELGKPVQGHDPCYCLYTSGSSGAPKGCLITHENAVQAMLAFQKIFGGRWTSTSRWLQFASFHFDVSVLEQFWSWSVGICVVTTPRDVLFGDISGVLTELNITHIDLTPSLARLITPEDVPSLCRGIFITGGEPLKQEVLDAWGTSGVIHNGYGPTECTIGCTMYPRVPPNGKPSNIGWQFENVGTYVFKAGTIRPVPRGAIGELCISGKLVGNGYLKRPDLTAESFTYLDDYGERVYRTKDLVRMLYDGSFEFLGRTDDQVKLRGQRLELGEINNAISNGHRGVQQAITVVCKRGFDQSEQLVAFIVFRSGNPRDSTDRNLKKTFRHICQAKLPSYMVPSHFVILSEIPLTANNKSDTKRLREIFEKEAEQSLKNDSGGKQNSEISGEHEAILCIIADFLLIPRTSLTLASNLFGLGLDSISAYGLARAFQRKGFKTAGAAFILKHQTAEDLANSLKSHLPSEHLLLQARHDISSFQRKHGTAIARRFTSSKQEFESVFPCTPLQHGMIAKALRSESRPYFNSFLYELDTLELRNFKSSRSSRKGSANATIDDERAEDFLSFNLTKRLVSAFQHVSEFVPILRTIFVPTRDGYSQAIRNGLDDRVLVIRDITAQQQLKEILNEYRSTWLKANSDILDLPIQVSFIRTICASKLYMLLNIFHGLYDATSLFLLLENIASYLVGTEPQIKPSSFFDALAYGPLQRQEGSMEFWKAHLRNASFRPLCPKDTKRSSSYHAASSNLGKLTKFEMVRRELGVTHQAVIQAVWIAVFQEWSKCPNTIGMVVSGRSIDFPDADYIIGPMFNTIPFSLKISQRDTWRSLAQRCHDFNISVLQFQHTPLRDIQKLCKIKTSDGLFDSIFVFQKRPYESFTNVHKIFKVVDTSAQSDYPLAFEVDHVNDHCLKASIAIEDHLADKNTCSSILCRFESVLRYMLEHFEEEASKVVELNYLASGDLGPVEKHDNYENGLHTKSNFTWTAMSTWMREALAELSGVPTHSIHEQTSIYQLGLDSIDAIKLSSAMRARGVNLSVSAILRHQSIQGMTKTVPTTNHVQEHNRPEVSGDMSHVMEGKLESLKRTSNETILPATPLQEAIVSEMISSGFNNYYNHDILLLDRDLDIDRLKAAWQDVFEHRDILRTTFYEVDDVDVPYAFVQAVRTRTELPWDTTQLPELDSAVESAQKVARSITEAVKKELLETGAIGNSLFKLTLASEKSGTKYLILSMSHALYDGWSLDLLHQDVSAAYYGQLPPRPSYTGVLDNIIQGQTDEAKEFWADALSGFEGCHFPVETNAADLTYRFERTSDIAIDDIRTFCKAQNIGLQALGHFCWSMVLATHATVLDVGFGVIFSGRDDASAQQAMFPTMSTVLIRHVISGSRKHMLNEAQSIIGSALHHQHLPLRYASVFTELASHELFNTLFIYQRKPPIASERTNLYESVGSSSSVEYPVCIEMEVIGGRLLWRSACSARALSETASQQVLEDLDQVLRTVMLAPEAPSVEFHGDRVSVCGMPPFLESSKLPLKKPKAEHLYAAEDSTISHESASQSSSMSSKVEADVIETLSKISKTPEHLIRGNDTIYHLGLDSISLIKVAAILKRKQVHLSVSDMLKAGTIQEIVSVATTSQLKTRTDDFDAKNTFGREMEGIDVQRAFLNAGISEENVERVIPATPAQVFFISQWQNTNGALFYPSFEYEVKGPLNLKDVREAWSLLVDRTELLRTVFAFTGDADLPMLQIIQKPLGVSQDGRDNAEIKAETEEKGTGVPPVRLCIKQANYNSIRLRLRIHHALYDAVSLSLLIQQLERQCQSVKAEIGAGGGNGAFISYIGQVRAPRAKKMRRAFWTEYLKHARAEAVQHVSQVDLSLRTSIYQPRILEEAEKLMNMLKKQGLGIQALFIAIVARVYSIQRARYTQPNGGGSENVVLGVYLANRSHTLSDSRDGPEEALVGLAAPTLNLVPLLVESPRAKSIFACASQVQKHLGWISTPENSTVGLWEVEKWTGVTVDCFVNFLTLPDEILAQHEKNSTNREMNARGVMITEARTGHESKEQASNSAEEASCPGGVGLVSGVNAVGQTFIPAWDVEAAVRQGAIDVGIFGPLSILDQVQAKSILGAIKLELEMAADEAH